MRGIRPEGEDHVTEDRALKQAIRRRMQETGEKYTEARRAVLDEASAGLTENACTASPPWYRPPGDVVPGVVAAQVELARTDGVVLAAGRFAAYPSGFEFKVWAVGRTARKLAYFDMPLKGRLPEAAGEEPPPEVFRLELHFSDGTTARNFGTPPTPHPLAERPSWPILFAGAGMAGGDRSEQEYWVSPLPPAGPLTFVCEWPANGVPRTRAEIDAGLIVDAAARAEQLSPDARV